MTASLALAAILGGCQPPSDGAPRGSVESDLDSTNGLTQINGLSLTNGLSGNGLSGNGLSGNGLSGNGLSGNGLSGNGLSGNGLVLSPLSTTGLTSSTYLMNSTAGRSTLSYLIRCALPLGTTITKNDSTGASYPFGGQIGVAPEWQTGTCNATCQERVSACMLAHVNTAGRHIAIWLDGEGAIGYGQSPDFPYQEGSFFGNIFISPPVADFCNGKDFDSGTVPGRLGVGQMGAPYKDPFYATAPCAGYCTPAPSPNSADGFKQCLSYAHVVTVWRNFDPNTQYKICNKQNGKCLEVAGSSTSINAAVVQATYTAATSQQWMITQIAPKMYRVLNVNSGKALDITSGRTADGTPLVQSTYSGAPSQLWAFTSLSDQTGFYVVSPNSNLKASIGPARGQTADGTAVQEVTYNTADFQKWTIVPG